MGSEIDQFRIFEIGLTIIFSAASVVFTIMLMVVKRQNDHTIKYQTENNVILKEIRAGLAENKQSDIELTAKIESHLKDYSDFKVETKKRLDSLERKVFYK